jgi:hypothetical protein
MPILDKDSKGLANSGIFCLFFCLLKHLQHRLVAIKSSLISLVKRLKHKKRQYFKADNNPRASFAFFFHLVNFLNIYS